LFKREPPPETKCPRCGVPVPAQSTECSACGWDLRESYHDPLAPAAERDRL
jgi:ribosomal protein L37E